jgi:hypothetical protein
MRRGMSRSLTCPEEADVRRFGSEARIRDPDPGWLANHGDGLGVPRLINNGGLRVQLNIQH